VCCGVAQRVRGVTRSAAGKPRVAGERGEVRSASPERQRRAGSGDEQGRDQLQGGCGATRACTREEWSEAASRVRATGWICTPWSALSSRC
jgi:hypothetical protein